MKGEFINLNFPNKGEQSFVIKLQDFSQISNNLKWEINGNMIQTQETYYDRLIYIDKLPFIPKC